jgi:hypothetical protein
MNIMAIGGAIIALCSAVSAQQVIELHSGNGNIGTHDSMVSFLLGPIDSNFDHSFNAGDFAAAKGGPGAFIISPDFHWIPSLPSVPSARWITTDVVNGPNYGATALFAVSFNVPDVTLLDATLDVWFSVDNWLGGVGNNGLFLNGVSIPGTIYSVVGAEKSEHAFLGIDITALVHPGTNTLYLYDYDAGFVAGLIFGARVTLNPEQWVDLGAGLAGQSGIPALTGIGSLSAGSSLQLALNSAKPFALAPLVVGLSNLSAPFKGGVLVPYPNYIFPAFTDFFGKSTFSGLWPAGVPSGFTTYFQWWIQDPAGPQGYAASNAVAGTAP